LAYVRWWTFSDELAGSSRLNKRFFEQTTVKSTNLTNFCLECKVRRCVYGVALLTNGFNYLSSQNVPEKLERFTTNINFVFPNLSPAISLLKVTVIFNMFLGCIRNHANKLKVIFKEGRLPWAAHNCFWRNKFEDFFRIGLSSISQIILWRSFQTWRHNFSFSVKFRPSRLKFHQNDDVTVLKLISLFSWRPKNIKTVGVKLFPKMIENMTHVWNGTQSIIFDITIFFRLIIWNFNLIICSKFQTVWVQS
jgi:hypothetical protein